MIQHSQKNIHYAGVYLDSTEPTYFAFKSGYLDMHTMKYRVFGATWKTIDGRKYILGYWFADNPNEIHRFTQEAGFSNTAKAKENEINEIYLSIRMEQDKDNWTKRSMLHLFSMMKKPWKDLRKGWYVLRSDANFPMVLTCIQKKRYSIWIEHIQVCETEADIKKFINLINTEHNIKLIPEMIKNH